MARAPDALHGKLRGATCAGRRQQEATTALEMMKTKRRYSKLKRYRRARDSLRAHRTRQEAAGQQVPCQEHCTSAGKQPMDELADSSCRSPCMADQQDALKTSQRFEELCHSLRHKLDLIASKEDPSAGASATGTKRRLGAEDSEAAREVRAAHDFRGSTPSLPSRAQAPRRKRALLALTATSQTRTRMRTWVGSMPGSISGEVPTVCSASQGLGGQVNTQEVVERILAAETSEDVLGVQPGACEETVANAWKRLVLILHPDKLSQLLDDEMMEEGAEALQRVHMAKDELRQQDQRQHCAVPPPPEPAQAPHCSSAVHRDRKYEIHWRVPDHQDPHCPVERYEVWGPRLFNDLDGEPCDWVMLVSLSNRQSHFVLVEQAPTQQDVMWAADRVRRPTLPLAVHACNGAGSSEPCVFELPWGTAFHWLRGTSATVCPSCLRVGVQRNPWSQCKGCGKTVTSDQAVLLRCPECHGEVLWSGLGNLQCTSCFRVCGKESGGGKKSPKPPSGPPPGREGRARGRSYGEW
mmetsp:Transcript_23540/g.43344  ORF Transcript_23540/g.43344 Transcript_23540/m.43344 type:complete len:524 (-) Transcript_23540:31-1602(-)